MPPLAARPAGSTPITSTPEARYEFFSRQLSLMRCVASPRLACLGGGASSARAAEHIARAIAVHATASLEPLPKKPMDDFPHVPPSMGDSPVTTPADRLGALRPTFFSTDRVPGCPDIVNGRLTNGANFCIVVDCVHASWVVVA